MCCRHGLEFRVADGTSGCLCSIINLLAVLIIDSKLASSLDPKLRKKLFWKRRRRRESKRKKI